MTIRQFSDAIFFLAAVTVGLAILAIGRLWYSLPTSLLVGGLAVWIVLCVIFAKLLLKKSKEDDSAEENLAQPYSNSDDIAVNIVQQIDGLREEIREMRSVVDKLVEMQSGLTHNYNGTTALSSGDHGLSVYPPQNAPVLSDVYIEPLVLDATIKRALRDNRVDLYLQPVVKLPSRRVVLYEGLARIRDDQGDVLSPATFASALADGPLATALDSLLFVRAAGLMRQLEAKRPDLQIFCNLSRSAVLDAGFIGGLVQFLTDQRERAAKLVFEITARDFLTLPEHALDRLSRLVRLGCQLSVDQVETLDVRPAVLARAQVSFVKISAGVLAASRPLTEFARFKNELDRFGIQIIATHIEDERTVIEVLELGIEYGQGYLFGAPRQARIDSAKTAAA